MLFQVVEALFAGWVLICVFVWGRQDATAAQETREKQGYGGGRPPCDETMLQQ